MLNAGHNGQLWSVLFLYNSHRLSQVRMAASSELVQELLAKRARFSSHTRNEDVLPSQVATYCVPFTDVVMILLCFSTPDLGCHDILHVGSRTSKQHSIEIGVREGEGARAGQFLLTTGLNGDVGGSACYKEYPPPNSERALQIEINEVYFVLIILDLKHSFIEYFDLNPTLSEPSSFYRSDVSTSLVAEWLRPLGQSHRLEFKHNIALGQEWEQKFFFPGTLHHCHQWQLDFPGEVDAWNEVIASFRRQQELALSVAGHSGAGALDSMREIPDSITRHCLSMLVKVSVTVLFRLKGDCMEMVIKGKEACVEGLDDVECVFSRHATERVLLHMHQCLCPGQVTSWSYVCDAGSVYIPCAGARFPPIIGGLIPLLQECVQFKASFWKRK